MRNLITLIIVLLFSVSLSVAQEKVSKEHQPDALLNTYLIEREIPNVGESTTADLKGISQKSCGVLKKMNTEKIQWVHSYVAEDKIYCIYKAESEDLVRKHATEGGFPINSVTVVSNVISPETAEDPD